MTNVLVTGGAGFIGSHVVDDLVEAGYSVTVLDSLAEQVHDGKPDYLNDDASYVWGDVRDRDLLTDLLADADVLSHQASVVGVGQSMYEIERYVEANTLATARLLDIVVDEEIDLEKIVVAASMSSYGEGEYDCEQCDDHRHPKPRDGDQLRRGEWELSCPECDANLEPVPTSERIPRDSGTVYSITKRSQEELVLSVADAYDIPAVALRYFNVYGKRQSLDNPYTGVCAIFSSRIKNDSPPLVFEDGAQTRDFVHVSDVARANRLAIESGEANGEAINVGTGTSVSVEQVAETLIDLYDAEDISPDVTGDFREGDIRHCFADTTKAEQLLGFEARVEFEDGMRQLVEWGKDQSATDRFDDAYQELDDADLVESSET